MNILIISQYFWPENFRINEIVNSLINKKHTVEILTGYPNYPNGKIFGGWVLAKMDQAAATICSLTTKNKRAISHYVTRAAKDFEFLAPVARSINSKSSTIRISSVV